MGFYFVYKAKYRNIWELIERYPFYSFTTKSLLIGTQIMRQLFHYVFFAHPAAINETYLQHLLSASGFALRLLLAMCACLVHALIPCLFTHKASDMLQRLHDDMVTQRAKKLDQNDVYPSSSPTPR